LGAYADLLGDGGTHRRLGGRLLVELRLRTRAVRGERFEARDHALDERCGDALRATGVAPQARRRRRGILEGAELVYVLVFFLSLFYGVYSFFGWFFYA
jgi:hypothetical protein